MSTEIEHNKITTLADVNNALRKAVADRDKREILRLYDVAATLDLEAAPDFDFEDYEDLITQGNEILF